MSCPATELLDAHLVDPSPELDRHIAGCDECRAALHRLRADSELARDLVAAVRGDPRVERMALTCEGYDLLRELHRGGQGVVYEAIQTSTGRHVAIKVLLQGAFASARALRRFEREVELAASLDHPHIVTVFDSGTTGGGERFFAMQLVDGVPANRMPGALAEKLETFRAICDAVDHAHSRGVLHRDLKPANVLIDGEGQPHVLDFGLAVPAGGRVAGAEASHLTRAGEFVGTLAYASPEHVAGDPRSIDVRSDVYALGVMLYEILTGRFPYRIEGSLAEVVQAITSTEPASPASGRGYVPQSHAGPLARVAVDRDLETIVLKALAKDKERRYATAGHLGRDLERYLAGEPIDARRDSTLYVLRKTLERHRLGAATAAAVLVLILGAAITTTLLWRRAVAHAREAEAIGTFFTDLLQTIDPDRARGREVTVREFLDDAAQRLAADPPAEPAAEYRLRRAVGLAYGELELPREALPQLELALALAERLYGEGSLEVARSVYALGWCRSGIGPSSASETDLQRGIELLDAHGEEALADRAWAYLTLAQTRGRRVGWEAAETVGERALELGRRAFGEPSRFTARFWMQDVRRYFDRGDFARAIERALELMRTLELLGERDSVLSVTNHILLGLSLSETGDAEGARDALEAAGSLTDRLFGAAHTRSLLVKSHLLGLPETGATVSADELYRELLEIRPVLRLHPVEHGAIAMNNLAVEAMRRGDYRLGAEVLEESLGLYRESVESGSPILAVTKSNLADCYKWLGRYAEARRMADEAIADLRRELGPGTLREAWALEALAWILSATGETAASLQTFHRAMTIHREAGGEHATKTMRALGGRGFCHYLAGNLDEARRDLEQVIAWHRGNPGRAPAVATHAMDSLAWVEVSSTRLAEAEALFRESFELRRRTLGEEHWQVGESLNGLGVVLGLQGRDPKETEALFRRALERMLPQGEDFPRTPWVLSNLGQTLVRQGRLDEAVVFLDQAVQRGRRTAHRRHPLLGVALASRGVAHQMQKEYAEARALFEEGLEVLLAAHGEEHFLTQGVLRMLANVCEALGDEAAAAGYRSRIR